MGDIKPQIVYHSVMNVLTLLRKDEYKPNENMQSVLDIYDSTVREIGRRNWESHHPFIVLEGLDGCGTCTTGFQFAKKINAKLFQTPPPSLTDLRPCFNNNSELRLAFYSLGNYIAALNMAKSLLYWQSTAVFALAQAVVDDPSKKQIPDAGDSNYDWPSDILRPNIVIYMEISENVRFYKHSLRRTAHTEQENLLKDDSSFCENVKTAYKRFVNPSVVEINANGRKDQTMEEIMKKFAHLL